MSSAFGLNNLRVAFLISNYNFLPPYLLECRNQRTLTGMPRFRSPLRYLNTEVIALYYAMKDSRTPFIAKALVFASLGYLVSPIDFIPDFIPFFGLVDDLVIFPVILGISRKIIPVKILEEGRLKAKRFAKTAVVVTVLVLLLLVFLVVWLVGGIG
jgi:uncharacterized membrane protein YkvA (DUF1232 family)